MNKNDKITEQELKRNGEGYWDPTAYKAIKRADAEKEKKDSNKKNIQPKRSGYYGAYDTEKTMTLEQYIYYKFRILRQLGIELTEEQKEHMKSCKNDREVDRYARDLIIGEE